MESNNLPALQKKIPLRAYPEKSLDEVLATQFKYFLSKLLSIKADKEEQLNDALVAVKKHFWSLGIDEAKKAFVMYAEGKFNIEPQSNYIDYILVGKIYKEYQKQKPQKKPQMIKKTFTEEEKRNLTNGGVFRLYKMYNEEKYIPSGYVWIYDYLFDELKIKEWSKEEKQIAYKLAKEEMFEESRSLDREKAKDIMREIEKKVSAPVINLAKKKLIESYFNETTEHKLKKILNYED